VSDYKVWLRFWSHVSLGDGCWEWTGSLTEGYGQVQSEKRKWLAHRLAYVWMIGPIPSGLELDHLCRNRRCVNPHHLEPVTRRENILRGEGPSAQAARLTHCKRGHDLALNAERAGEGHRRCRVCARATARAYYHRQRRAADVA
jgi:hypothetical protein